VIRVYVVVEGQTEESFVKNVLAPVLWPVQICLIPILLGRTGGRPNYPRVKRDLVVLLKQDSGAYCTTMLDLYGLGDGFPGTPVPANGTGRDKALHIELAMKTDISEALDIRRPDIRFVPYLQVHEYEGLLFSDPAAFASGIGHAEISPAFNGIRSQFPTPEDINDSPNNAPSKRVLRAYPSYRKPVDGTLAAKAVGIDRMRQECPHFQEWIQSLEGLARCNGG
jgi:hypothetical protein